jgi:hypothetical protein
MKIVTWVACLTLAALVSGCYTPPAATVAVQSPQPIPPPTGYVTYTPEYYTWDGYEYVGVAGGQYVYWDGRVWLAASPVILGRFHGWERYHPEWRRTAIHYHHHQELYQYHR